MAGIPDTLTGSRAPGSVSDNAKICRSRVAGRVQAASRPPKGTQGCPEPDELISADPRLSNRHSTRCPGAVDHKGASAGNRRRRIGSVSRGDPAS